MTPDKSTLNSRTAKLDSPWFLDPSVLQAARAIYRCYLEVNYEQMQRPLGIAISRVDRRGQLIFSSKPILLPGECFVPFEHIESQIY